MGGGAEAAHPRELAVGRVQYFPRERGSARLAWPTRGQLGRALLREPEQPAGVGVQDGRLATPTVAALAPDGGAVGREEAPVRFAADRAGPITADALVRLDHGLFPSEEAFELGGQSLDERANAEDFHPVR